MSTVNTIRAWKDADYRASLSESERAALPEHPAGLIELDDTALDIFGAMIAPVTGYGTTFINEGCDVSGKVERSCGFICTFTSECLKGTSQCC